MISPVFTYMFLATMIDIRVVYDLLTRPLGAGTRRRRLFWALPMVVLHIVMFLLAAIKLSTSQPLALCVLVGTCAYLYVVLRIVG